MHKFYNAFKIILIFILCVSISSCSLMKSSTKKANTPKKSPSPKKQAEVLPSTVPSSVPSASASPSLSDIQNSLETSDNNTPNDSILDVGKTWIEDGSEITLDDVSLVNNKNFKGISFSLEYKNKKNADISFNYVIKNSIQAYTNDNKLLPIVGYNNDFDYSKSGYENTTLTEVVSKGKTVTLSKYNQIIGICDIGDENLKYVLIRVSNISNVQSAVWKIPLYH